MRTSINRLMLGFASLAATMLGAAGVASAATTVNLTAQRATATMPDGAIVPMWGYCLGSVTSTSTPVAGTASGGGTCATAPAVGTWAPGPTITVPLGDSLTITLTNNLPVDTSITILGQIGGNLGAPARDALPVSHAPVTGTTWPVTGGTATFTPPAQLARANSFVPVAAAGSTATYTWSNLKPGTYLYETATRPSLQAPMGLYGVLIVTGAPTTDATATTPATHLTAAGTAFPNGAVNGVAVQAVQYDADVPFLISEIDAKQNAQVDAAALANTSVTLKWNDPACATAGPAPNYGNVCYPAAVNYAPTYLLLNGQPFDRNNPGANAVQPATGNMALTGNVMLRVVNAGLRTHVPSLVGLTLAQIAEDGNRAPGVPQLVSELLMTAGKTRDVLVQPANNGVAASSTPPTAYTEAAYGFYDRALGLSTNGRPNGGAQGYLALVSAATLGNLSATGGSTLNTWLTSTAGKAAIVTPTAVADTFSVPGYATTYTGNVLVNDIGVYSAAAPAATSAGGSVSMAADGTFVYTAPTGGFPQAGDTFTYCGNGAAPATPGLCTTVTLNNGGGSATVTAKADTYTSAVATLFRAWGGNGVLANDVDSNGLPLTASNAAVTSGSCQVTLNPDGSFTASNPTAPFGSVAPGASTCTFTYTATDSQGASATASATVNFLAGSNLNVTVRDALGFNQLAGAPTNTTDPTLSDYSWIIEEDPTFHHDPMGNTPAPDPATGNPALTISNSFHVSHTPIVAAGCTGSLSCGDAQTINGGGALPAAPRSSPWDVALDPTKHYFISILPGDASNAFVAGYGGDPTAGNCTFSNTDGTGKCGHTIGGAMIGPAQAAVTVLVDPNPLKPAQLSIIAFEDNNPINGDIDDGETGLGGFNVVIFDAAGRSGDPAGQITYDAFNMPLTNWLLGKPGCPNEENPTVQGDAGLTASGQNGLTGVIYTCPDGHRNIASITIAGNGRFATVTTKTPHGFTAGLSVDMSGVPSALFNASFVVAAPVTATSFRVAVPAGYNGPSTVPLANGASVRDPARYSLAGHALVKNIMPGRFDVLMHPSAAREGDGETWYQVSTLEGTPANDAFAKAGEPAYFQEFGPPGYHAFVGWMNPDRIATMQQLMGQGNIITGRVTNLHMSRPSQIYNYDAATNDPLKNSICYVALNTGSGNGAAAAFAKCDSQGNFTLKNVPYGNHQVVVWDQWLDQIIAYFNVYVPQPAPGAPATGITVPMGDLPVFSWFTMVQENAFVYNDANCPTAAISGATDQASLQTALAGCATTPLAQIPITIRFRDGSISNILQTDSNGNATFAELFPLFNWYVAEVDQTRYAPLTAHVVVDGGGQPDCTTPPAVNPSGSFTSSLMSGCQSVGGLNPGVITSTYPTGESTEHTYTAGELFFGLQGFISQTEKIDWGKTVVPADQTGGISGTVVYASTRGFDDPSLEIQFLWEPLVPRVPVNLYQKLTAPDGTTSLRLVAQTYTTSWDDVAAGTYPTTDPRNPLLLGKPSCPGQVASDPYVAQVLGSDLTRCYDGFHNWNQVQPLTYDGYYQFTSIYPSGINADGTPVNGKETPVAVPQGQFVVEIVPPAGYEIVKEEDKNILIGDAWVAPPAQQFAALSNIFILPDQATVASAYNLNITSGATQVDSRLGFTLNEGTAQLPVCAGAPHRVPDYLSLFPTSGQVAPFAGADRPLCDRKLVNLNNGQNGTANFFVFSNTPRAAKFTGIILDDASAEFNVAAPDFGEKFGVPYVAVSIRDAYGIEIERVYADQWGGYNGMTPSSWQVNVPNPAGYSPNMLITCMNDPGPIQTANGPAIDPMYMPTYSNFCYTNPFMPGLTTYLDTPVLPVGAFASNYVSGYNPVDCSYPDATPAVSTVYGDVHGPWLKPSGSRTLTINALGDVNVPNPAYLGPTTNSTSGINQAPYNQKTILRHYRFGATAGTATLTAANGTVYPLTIGSWGDMQISATVPTTVPNGTYELGITSANGQQSVDTVSVTIEAKQPVVLTASSNSVTTGGASTVVQDAIDAATPGDLIILDAGVYNELVVMYKPVRLQGAGAASVVINAAKYPTDKLERWRPEINSLFSIDVTSGNQVGTSQVDPLPGQEVTGGIVFLEPSVLATEEGAGVTVLAKDLPANECKPASNGSTRSTYVDRLGHRHDITESNFRCARSRIDGITVTGGDAGGGIYVNGWAHGLEVANNRVYGNAGAFGGGIRVGIPHLETQDPVQIAQGFDNNVSIHHNAITQNGLVEAAGAVGATAGASGAGAGLALCTGTNNYKANYNFICGNYSSGDGGGLAHYGWSSDGSIAHNTIIFNQSFFQQSTTNGGGLAVEGDQPAAGGVSLGVGSVTIDSNLIQGNFAQGGHGGGVAFVAVNGSDTVCGSKGCSYDSKATLTNNLIVDNVAGWSAGGVYLLDSFNVNIVNNTVAMNDSVGIAGALFNGGNNGRPNPAGIAADATSPAFKTLDPAVPGYSFPHELANNIVWKNRSFYANLSGTLNAPNNVGLQGTAGPWYPNTQLCSSNDVSNVGTSCVTLSTSLSSGMTALQTLATGACDPAHETYWDLGLVGDANATPGGNHLSPVYSVLTATAGYAASNTSNDPALQKPYCNGSQTISASSDEQGNFVDFRYGPLSLTAPIDYTAQSGTAQGQAFGDYHITTGSSAIDAAESSSGNPNVVPNHDYFGTPRPQGCAYDIGANEYVEAPCPPQGTVSATSLTFGSLVAYPGANAVTNASQTLRVSNAGPSALNLTGLTFSNAAFSRPTGNAGGSCGSTLAAGLNCTIIVAFTPTAAQIGPVTGTLTIASNSSPALSTVNLSGVEVPELTLAATGLTVQPNPWQASWRFGSSSNTRTLTIRNTSTQAVTLSGLSLVSTTNGSFVTASGGTCTSSTTLAAGTGSCTVAVHYTRTAGVSASGSLTITSNGVGSPQVVALSGT
ncbi:MAG: choice-of-anchor D domain-containing protein [Proteobacteria bacterium]|nr:choice-of-anchor D domain-containing protein [Pseudomonadota bacterium]